MRLQPSEVSLPSTIRRRLIAALPCIVVLSSLARGANEVPNPSFEVNTSCPSNASQLHLATPWTASSPGTPDYFNSCATGNADVPNNWIGSQSAFNGEAYAGFAAYSPTTGVFREYVQVPLSSALVASTTYEVKFFVSRAEGSRWACDSIGAWFQTGAVSGTTPHLIFASQVVSPGGTPITASSGWTLVSGTFVATGGEDHMLIGNCNAQTATTATLESSGGYDFAYYYLDLVSVEPLETGSEYCGPAVANSTGLAAVIAASGSTSASDNDLTLIASNLPPNQFGYFLVSATQGFIASPGGSQGNLCLSGSIGRFNAQIRNSGASGSFSIQADLTALPTSPAHVVLAGETWNFTCWYRDVNPTSTSNFTNGLSVTFD